MHTVNLKRLIAQREVSSFITDLIAMTNVPLAVWDTQSNLLLGAKGEDFKKQFETKSPLKIICQTEFSQNLIRIFHHRGPINQ